MAETRKLAAILAADVVGYSRLAGSDDEQTLARLRALRSDLIDPGLAALMHWRKLIANAVPVLLASARKKQPENRLWVLSMKAMLIDLLASAVTLGGLAHAQDFPQAPYGPASSDRGRSFH
jgi:class 3 adenylate cyclase